MLQSSCSLAMHTIGIAFVAENVGESSVGSYVAWTYFCASFGSTIVIIVASLYIHKQFVDPSADNPPAPDDPNFVGNWWAVYCAAVPLAVFIAFLLWRKSQMQRPPEARPNEQIGEAAVQERPWDLKREVVKMVGEARDLLRIASFRWICFGAMCEMLLVSEQLSCQ